MWCTKKSLSVFDRVIEVETEGRSPVCIVEEEPALEGPVEEDRLSPRELLLPIEDRRGDC